MFPLLQWVFGSLAEPSMAAKQLESHELDETLKKYTSEAPNSLQGVTFSAFNSKGETLYSHACGRRALDLKSEALAADTPVWTSSITKLITTVACLIAVDQGLISLDENVREIVPQLKDVKLLAGFEDSGEKPRKPILKDVLQPITLRQLLSHTSGYTYDVFDAGLMEWSRSTGRTTHSHCGSLEGYTHPLIHEPGRGWAYGPGMDWGGRAIEIRSGLSLEQFMQEHIFSKLGMDSTTFHPESRSIAGESYLSYKMEHATRDPPITGPLTSGGRQHVLALPAKDCIGGMGLYSTPNDLVKFLKEVLVAATTTDAARDANGTNGTKSAGSNTPTFSPQTQRLIRDEMLQTQLNPQTQAAFMEVIDGRAKYHLRQTWPEGYEGTFGLSASINNADFSGRRSAKSMNWAGSAGLHAWIDPASGVGGLITTQLAPPGDPMFTRCFLELEEGLYTQLRK